MPATLDRGLQPYGNDLGQNTPHRSHLLEGRSPTEIPFQHPQLVRPQEVWAKPTRPAALAAASSTAQASEGLTAALPTEQELQTLIKALESNPSMCRRLAAAVNAQTAGEWAAARMAVSDAADQAQSSGSPVHQACSTNSPTPSPKSWQLCRLHLRTAVPFIGFGFFDNMIMLTVGGTIESTIGVTCGISALCAAGMGQMVSDAAGITLQGLIERFADGLGLPHPQLTLEQRQMPLVQSIEFSSRVFGIVVGCCLGMLPLLIPQKPEAHVDQVASALSQPCEG